MVKKTLLFIGLILLLTLTVTGCGKKELDLNKTTTKKMNDISFSLPTAFKSEGSEEDFFRIYSYVGEDYFCNITISINKKSEFSPTNPEKELKTYLSLDNTDSLTTKTIGNNEWTYGKAPQTYYDKEGYSILKNDNYYTIINGYTTGTTICNDVLEKVIKSISF